MASRTRGARLPLPITEKSPVLVSQIPLPPLPSIAYAKFVPTLQQEHQHKAVELARQHIINGVRRCGKSIEESLLPIVHIGKEDVALWVFSIRSLVHNQQPATGGKGKQKADVSDAGELEELAFDGLQRGDLSQFTPSDLYPCSSECAELPNPCSSCISMMSSSSTVSGDTSTFLSSATLFPRIPLRPIYTFFIDAVRDRLIDDVCVGPHCQQEDKATGNTVQGLLGRPSGATRLGRGFLSSGDHIYPAWGCGWEHRLHIRPLVHTSLDIYLTPTALQIRPLPTLTNLLPVPVWCSPSSSSQPATSTSSPNPTLHSPPLTPGIPLVLSPYSTPAFYVSTHSGTSISHSLRAPFWDALTGLGAFSCPARCFNSPSGHTFLPSTRSLPTNICASHLPTEPFVLVFIPLLNPQGDPKGITALWPAHLAFIDNSPNRARLNSLPEMPGTEILLTPPRGASAQSSARVPSPSFPSPLVRRRSSVPAPSDYLSRAQRAVRALELSSHKRAPEVQLRGTAKTTAGYVESVARERERERERAIQERIRREREAKEGKSSSSGALVPPSAISNVPTIPPPVGDVSGTDSSSPKAAVDTGRPGTSWHSAQTNFFAKAAQDSLIHSFYPSPPDWNPVCSAQNSGISDSAGDIAASTSSAASGNFHPTLHSQPGSNVNQQAIRGSLNLADGIDLGMDIDMNDMSMGINLGNTISMLNVDMDVSMDASGLIDGGFGSFADSFTDDDFNYFDTAPAPEPTTLAPDIQRPLHHLSADPDAVDGWLASGLEGGGDGASSQLQPVTPASVDATHGSLVGLHQMLEDDRELLPPAPDLIPSSPAKTAWSPSSPPTPSLELNAPPTSPVAKPMFEPIYFGNRHHVADGKYRDTRGKFAFPSTIPRSSPKSVLAPGLAITGQENGWKLRYDAITDPRVGVVTRLRGVKRKLDDLSHTSKNDNGRLRDEEWESIYDHMEDAELGAETSSSEEDEEIEEMELDQDQDQDQEDDFSSQSRPSRSSTPPPSGLPLTLTLLYFQFHHAYLLPLGVPMRPSYGELVSSHNPPPAAISVPTPVSPAAALGTATERDKTLELLAQAIAKEAVENHTWAESWGSSSGGLLLPQTAHEVSPTDLKHIARLMENVPGMKGPTLFSDLLKYSSPTNVASTPHTSHYGKSLQMLPLPKISICRAGLVHHMLPTVVRFWEKEGLGPRGGTKDVVAFALFEENEDNGDLVKVWMERVGRVYSARGFGRHTVGNAGSFEGGLVPVQFETVRKTLPSLMAALPRDPQHIVIYIIAPPSIYSSLKSPALRAILMSQKRISKLGGQHDFDQDRVLVHFVPDHYITDPYIYPNVRHVGLKSFVTSVYDRLLRATLRQTSRQFWTYNPPFENRFQLPAFTLARNTPQTHIQWDERPSLNVLDRHTFLHVGYRLSKCMRWLLAACIDERGEAHDVAVWGVPRQNEPHAIVTWMVSNIWIFVKQFAQRADTEWRIVVSKLGEVGETEVEVWMAHLETMVSAHTGPPVHVSLICAQNNIPLPFLRPTDSVNGKQSTTVSEGGAVFSDVSSVTYSVLFPHRTPIISHGLLYPWEQPSIVTPATSGDEEADAFLAIKQAISILPLSTTALLRVPNNGDHTNVETLYIHLLFAYKSAKSTLKKTTHEVHADITRNWYDLAVLTRERWQFKQQGELPFHLAALELMSNVLDPNVLTPDAKDTDFLGR